MYPTIRSAMLIFGIEVGLGNDEAGAAVLQNLQNQDWRDSLEAELEALLIDPTPPWRELIENEEYEVDEPEDANQARAILLDLLWPLVFPGRPLPQPEPVLNGVAPD